MIHDSHVTGKRVSIVIPCRNEASSIGELLDHLVATTGPDTEILVADGLSDDGTREIVAGCALRHDRIVLIENPGLLVSSGLNRAISRASGEYIVRLDAHTRYADDYIDTCIEVLETTGADNVGGPQLAEASGYIASAIASTSHSPAVVGGSRIHDPSYEGPTDSVIYGCWRRSLFERVGLFDEELARNQDGELNRRITSHGGTIWQTPRIRSWYRPRGRLRDLWRQYMQYGYWKTREIQKFRTVWSLRHVIPAAFLFAAPLLWLAGIFSTPALALAAAASIGYVAFIMLATIHLCVRERAWRLFPVIPAAFVCMQLGYGTGFLLGAWNFWILRRRGQPEFERLTR